MKKSEFINLLNEYKIIQENTGLSNLSESLEAGGKIYLGFDLTAISLHWGHYFLFLVLNKAWEFGIKTVIVLGDFTTKIGDASWRIKERKVLSEQEIKENLKGIKKQVKKLSPHSEIVLNSIFYKNFGLEEFAELLKNFKTFELLSKDFFSSRLSTKSLTLKDLFYPVLQSYDFYKLAISKGVTIQLGGKDQWGNIVTGINFVKKKKSGILAGGFTIPLLTDAQGAKIGKSGKNTLFLDENLSSPYQVYQYFWNLSNHKLKEISRFLFDKKINLYKKNEIDQERRAEILEKLLFGVYSKNKIRTIRKSSEKLFLEKKNLRMKNLTEKELKELSNFLPFYESNDLTSISNILIKLGFSSSHSESKRLIELEKCVSCFDHYFKKHKEKLDPNLSTNSYFLIKKGEKSFGIFHLSSRI